MGSPVVWFVVALGLLLLAALIVAGLAWRRLRELRVGGIDVALRASKDGGRGWHLGVAHYRGEEFTWYRVLSLRSGPNWVINRRDVEIARRREPTVSEAYAMPAGSTVLDLTGPDLELAMGRDALTGFLSWLESAPPGRSVPWAS
ncbi:Protein of unknown function [Saccharopolyspora kobensis]|uniref:DUF2550 family protein n=1 Tax=Saccharopolyspora kobensis TaxID=146035 RepID=A0A1H6EK88_9PSEU|nr:DUF2550 domain-containing protein [Saccharopolyspora kobensis]SEG98260.1 Protein of unknown function [Saccharopolyspora kobensis]SFE71371.1 Protein of unknown function [Saccharopolyspora kobensis]